MKDYLQVYNLRANINGKPILKGIDLEMASGEVHALMGPNGSGKSTLANVLMGNPQYEVTDGKVFFKNTALLGLGPAERALLGLFLAFQYPVEIPGITVGRFLKRALELQHDYKKEGKSDVSAFIKELRENMDFLEMDQAFINRYLNEGFSGGEKKRMEILQMLMLKPAWAILDETDSGLDIDALRVVAKGVNRLRGEGFGALVITHYQRILNYIKPDFVHIMYQGKIITSGSSDLVSKLEEQGYDWVRREFGIEVEEENYAKQN